MDIKQLSYFVAIVENDYNISLASQKLHISQPALTQSIKKFESDENILLFHRFHGRLQGLTPAGKAFYENALTVLHQHRLMIKELREYSDVLKGKVRIGIPPVVISLLFPQVLVKLITSYPGIQFDVLEKGAFELRRMLLLEELDFAVILQPTELSPQLFSETILNKDELVAYISKENPLAKQEYVTWNELGKTSLAIFNSTFMLYHQICKKFRSFGIEPNIELTSPVADVTLEAVRSNPKFVTILPLPLKDKAPLDGLAAVRIQDPIQWITTLVYPKKPQITRMEQLTIDTILKHFHVTQE